jgi:hypothetical protein
MAKAGHHTLGLWLAMGRKPAQTETYRENFAFGVIWSLYSNQYGVLLTISAISSVNLRASLRNCFRSPAIRPT